MSLEGKASATIQNYLRAPKELMLHLDQLPEECTVDQIKSFLIHHRDSLQLSSSTVNMRVCGLKHYFRHVALRPDLVVNIPNPRIEKYHTEILSYEELGLLYRCCKDMRQVVLLSLMYECGLRVREIIRLRIGDFDKVHRTIAIRNSKGNKTRVVPYGSCIREDLVKYFKAIGGIPAGTIIESYVDKGKPLSTSGVQHIVKRLVRRSGLQKRIHPHTFRHTFAVHYLNNGGSLYRLQQLLGHDQITTTLHYLKYAKLPQGTDISNLDIYREQ